MSDLVSIIIFIVFCFLFFKKEKLIYLCVIKKYNQDGWEFKNDFCKNKSNIVSYYDELKEKGEIEDYKLEFKKTDSKELLKLPQFNIDEPWYYNVDDKLLYPYKSYVPQPLKMPDTENDFNINIEIAYYDSEDSDGESIEDFEKRILKEYIEYRDECFEHLIYNIKFHNNGKICNLSQNFAEKNTKLSEFLSEIEEKDYTILYSEYPDTFLSVWKVDKNNIRIFIEKICNHNENKLVLLDIILPKDKFINELIKVKEQVEYKIRENEINMNYSTK